MENQARDPSTPKLKLKKLRKRGQNFVGFVQKILQKPITSRYLTQP